MIVQADVPVPVQVQSGGVWVLEPEEGVLEPEGVAPPPTVPPPEQPQDCCSSQVKPAPQSAAVWQGNCQRGMH
jgi:hypothetical protein